MMTEGNETLYMEISELLAATYYDIMVNEEAGENLFVKP